MTDLAKKINNTLPALKGKSVILYGTGKFAKDLIQIREELCFRVVAILDRNADSGKFMDLPVIELSKVDVTTNDILITARGDNKEIIY